MHWVLAAWLLSASSGQMEAVRAALALEEKGDDAGALAALDKTIRAQPAWEIPRLEASRMRIKAGRELDRAELDLEAARALAPENPRAQYLWGLLQQEKGNLAEALRSFELAISYRTDYADARFRLAALQAGEGKLSDAEPHYRVLARTRPDWVHARLQLAQVLEKQGKVEDTERELRSLMDDFPGSTQVRQQLASFYERTDRPQLAEKALRGTEKKQRKLRPLPKSKR